MYKERTISCRLRFSDVTMPKALSLKKGHQTGITKNQKPITQFFKNATSADSQKYHISEGKTCLQSEKPSSSKRKASSPAMVDEVVGQDIHKKVKTGVQKSAPSKESDIKSINKENGFGMGMSCKEEAIQHIISPKKVNGVLLNESISLKKDNTISKKSLVRIQINENGYSTLPRKRDQGALHISPEKYTLKKEHLNSPETNEDSYQRDAEQRSPLTPVSIDQNNIQENPNHEKLKAKSCVQNLFTEQCKSPLNSPSKNHVQRSVQSHESKKSPKKSPPQGFHCSPITKLVTPEKSLQVLLSPSKNGSTVRSLDFGQDVGDGFDDEWELDGFEEEQVEDLDLSTIQRCEIVTAKNSGCRINLKLKNAAGNKGTCFVEGVWLDTPLAPGDKISVLAIRDATGSYSVGNTGGLLVLRPDHLVSSTSVVAGVFCKRKAVLQERWRGIDSANTAMTIGILIHELVQKALTQNISSIARLRLEADLLIKQSIQMLYDAGLSEDETRKNMQLYVNPLAEFMQNYVDRNGAKQQASKAKDNWSGHIDKVLDIEENLCCPQLGLKGKIDATLQVTIHNGRGNQQTIVPLELKSGKASVSAEHRGQLVLYGMMLSLQRREDPTQTVQRGLLLYLKERVDIREISCGYPERRDLIMLRNQLVQHLARGPEDVDPEQILDIEDASVLLQQRLPEPVNHHNACAKCPYLTLCSLHLWHTDGPSVSETHPLSKLRDSALGHLTATHIQYFLHWAALLRMEESGQMLSSPLHALWTDTCDTRAKRGTCASNLKLKTVTQSGDRYLHHFERNNNAGCEDREPPSGPQDGEFSIVSIENRPWIAAGVVNLSTQKVVQITLERDLSRRLNQDTLFHIDTYESYATTVQNLTNLGVLMEDSDRAERLRKLIIDKASPEFDKKLPRDVGRLGTKLMRSLNIQQQGAVLRAVTAKDYALLQGLPGTGKTQTVSVLIQMLAGLKQRVLVTAHTHSAVDTVLGRLPESLKIMRLGSIARMAPSLSKKSEQALIASCENPEQLANVYESMDVVGVTCLGAAHAMLSKTSFDVCIVDEATQVLQCTALRPLFAAKRFVLVGDPEQLPPVVRSRAARRLGMEESLFLRLMSEKATSTLQLQYRMNQALADIANKVAYNDRLKCANDNIAQATFNVDAKKLTLISDSPWLQEVCSTDPAKAALFIDIEAAANNGDSKKTLANEEEASVVLALVDALKKVGVKSPDIGVIAPYREQVSLLRRSLSHLAVEVSTVDQFQGRDKSVIVYSCTKRAGDNRKVKEGEILNDQRRLAVSVTRAKHKLIVVGNSPALHKYATLQNLIAVCKVIRLEPTLVTSLGNQYKNVVP